MKRGATGAPHVGAQKQIVSTNCNHLFRVARQGGGGGVKATRINGAHACAIILIPKVVARATVTLFELPLGAACSTRAASEVLVRERGGFGDKKVHDDPCHYKMLRGGHM